MAAAIKRAITLGSKFSRINGGVAPVVPYRRSGQRLNYSQKPDGNEKLQQMAKNIVTLEKLSKGLTELCRLSVQKYHQQRELAELIREEEKLKGMKTEGIYPAN